jgi:hypothetical protein
MITDQQKGRGTGHFHCLRVVPGNFSYASFADPCYNCDLSGNHKNLVDPAPTSENLPSHQKNSENRPNQQKNNGFEWKTQKFSCLCAQITSKQPFHSRIARYVVLHAPFQLTSGTGEER